MRKLLTLLFICLLASFAGAALAQTPDGDPPSVETICNDLNFVGAAFGLCNAWCEAMDCDCPTNGDLENPDCLPNASERACARVLANFHKHEPNVELTCEPLVAEFFTLDTTVIGDGVVTSDKAGQGGDSINCAAGGAGVCIETFADGTVVTLTATPAAGGSFLGWSGDCTADVDPNDSTVTMDQNRACTATFSAATCPCFDASWDGALTWQDFADGFLGVTACTDDPPRTELREEPIEGEFVLIAVDDPTGMDVWQCEAADSFGFSATFSITSAEATACADDLLALVPEGVTCGP